MHDMNAFTDTRAPKYYLFLLAHLGVQCPMCVVKKVIWIFRLPMTKDETNMLAIVSTYQEELNLATTHEHRVADEYAQVYAKKEARGRVIDSLHQEATMWMERFALTLNGSEELP